MSAHELHYLQPAREWTEHLPLGNGHLGAMLDGGIDSEHFELNEVTVWSGNVASEHFEGKVSAEVAAKTLREVREAVAAGDAVGADAAIQSIHHGHSQAFMPLGQLAISYAPSAGSLNVSQYERRLDIDTAVHVVRIETSLGAIERKTFISGPAQALVHEVWTDIPGGLTLNVTAQTQLRLINAVAEDRSLSLQFQLPSDVVPGRGALHSGREPVLYGDRGDGSLEAAIAICWDHDGTEVAGQDTHETVVDSPPALRATGISWARLVLSAKTTFTAIAQPPAGDAATALASARKLCLAAVEASSGKLETEHTAAYRELYDRVSLEFRPQSKGSVTTSVLPSDARLAAANQHREQLLQDDPQLAELLFHYGRYLLIASSHGSPLPANLQGLWNHQLRAPWSSAYTININLQMNYWMAEATNLPECLPPLFNLITALSLSGRETARRLYDAPGWVGHHNTDAWAYTQPVGHGEHLPKWANWPMAGPWLLRHFWERLLHGGGDDFAREQMWAPLHSACEFYLDWLVEQPDGTLGTSPSTSPENNFLLPDGRSAAVTASATMDLILVGDLFDMLAAVATRLGHDTDPVVVSAALARQRLADLKIGANGAIQEWAEDYAQEDPHHRHVSHLYFLHPGDRTLTPELTAAASRSLDLRGDDATGWSLAWKLAMRARLGQAEKVEDLLDLYFRDMTKDHGSGSAGLYQNLFAAHPPFQIDANFGFVHAITECLMQSHQGKIVLLPAVPRSLGAGRVRGLIARPGIEVNLAWDTDPSGAVVLVEASLRAHVAEARGVHRVQWGAFEVDLEIASEWVNLRHSE